MKEVCDFCGCLESQIDCAFRLGHARLDQINEKDNVQARKLYFGMGVMIIIQHFLLVLNLLISMLISVR
jgi:hypothetical protein